jgi:hypothetical protein
MSIASQTARAFAQSQRILAQMGGMAAAAAGNVRVNGAVRTGVFGTPRTDETMNPAGGFRKRAEITLMLTREQFITAPDTQTEVVRIDIAPNIAYRVASVDEHDPIHYALTLVKVGPVS